MDRIELMTLAFTVVIGVFLILGGSVAGPEIETIQLTLEQQVSQMTNTIYDLAYHSKSIVIESLTVIKQSLNLALDLAIAMLTL